MLETKPVLIIGGPTASGKSGLAVAAAEIFFGIVINADSMQIYDGLPCLTAQPAASDLKRAPHKLYGVLPPDALCSAMLWRDLALKEIEAAHGMGKLPIIVGGTGFYLMALLDGLSPIPAIPEGIREKLILKQREMGNPAFYQAFAKLDPITAPLLDPLNTQRVIRAWEVLEGTGKSLAEWQKLPRVKAPAHLRFHTIALLPEREILYQSCNRRFEQMMEQGVQEEVIAFMKICTPHMPLSKALGYPELAAYQRGEISLGEAIICAQQSTRYYAKRQVTWFRNQITADLVLPTPDVAQVATWYNNIMQT